MVHKQLVGKIVIIFTMLFLGFLSPISVNAQEDTSTSGGVFQRACEFLGGCEDEVEGLGTPETNLESAADLATRIARVFTISYGVVAAVLVGIMLWGVFKITTSGSNSEQKAEGFKILRNGIIGFFGSFVLVVVFFYLFVYLELVNFSDIPTVIFGEDL